jgi:hypothetical protein
MRVFISHASEDKAKCDKVRQALEDAQLSPWTAQEILAGERLRESLRTAIERSDVCVFIATANSVGSGWCLAETGAFWGAGKPVVVYVADDALPNGQVPALFEDYKWAASVREIVESVARLPETSALAHLGKRPANVFWLAHDLTRAIHIASSEPHNSVQDAERILQALHHLEKTGLDAADERRKLVTAWALAKSTALSDSSGKQLADKVADVRNDIVAKIVALQNPQGGFFPYPSSEAKDRIAQEAGLTNACT